jgi:cell division protease FtsH
VTEYGMSEKVGPLSFGGDGYRGTGMLYPGQAPEMSEQLSTLVDAEVSRLVSEAHDRATTVLTEHREFLEQMAELLQVTEVIDGPDLHAWFEGSRRPPSPEEIDRMRADGRATEGNGEVLTGPDVIVQPTPPRPI